MNSYPIWISLLWLATVGWAVTLYQLQRSKKMTQPRFSDDINFWKYRAIFDPKSLDFVLGHGGFKENQHTLEREKFLRDILDSKEFKSWLELQTPSSTSTFEHRLGNMFFCATNNASYGYTYLWAWEVS